MTTAVDELPAGAPEVQTFAAAVMQRAALDPELGPLMRDRFELFVIALDTKRRPMVRGSTFVLHIAADPAVRCAELLAHTLASLITSNSHKSEAIWREIARALRSV